MLGCNDLPFPLCFRCLPFYNPHFFVTCQRRSCPIYYTCPLIQAKPNQPVSRECDILFVVQFESRFQSPDLAVILLHSFPHHMHQNPLSLEQITLVACLCKVLFSLPNPYLQSLLLGTRANFKPMRLVTDPILWGPPHQHREHIACCCCQDLYRL